ncbi:class I SAM-dependent methyltransferase [Kaarinaea lacus]
MERTPEPDLMNEKAQAKAYAEADFSEPHENFVDLFKEYFSRQSDVPPEEALTGNILDLGCGPADVIVRFAKRFTKCNIVAVDGADIMLEHAREAVNEAGLVDRITLQKVYLPDEPIKHLDYQAIVSNSLLHHMKDPQSLWKVVNKYAKSGTFIFIMDLMRPRNELGAKELMEEYAGDEPEILQQDFYNSLLAAYTIAEVEEQLERERLIELKVLPVSDRHLVVHGYL